MDISAGTVLAGPNLTEGMDPGMNTNIKTEYMKSKYARISMRKILCFTKMHFSVRPVLHGEHVLNSFDMVISGMKPTFYT